jgi:hypothetical protein
MNPFSAPHEIWEKKRINPIKMKKTLKHKLFPNIHFTVFEGSLHASSAFFLKGINLKTEVPPTDSANLIHLAITIDSTKSRFS